MESTIGNLKYAQSGVHFMSEACKKWVGQVVGGEFPLHGYLGGSEHSAVFLTQYGEQSPQRAAIKFIQPDRQNEERHLARWKRAAQICHPGLIQIFRTGRWQIDGMDLLYVVMQYADENLSQILPQRPLSPEETRDVLEPVLQSLTYLHSQGFVHGQIKPSNILACNDQLRLSTDALGPIGESSLSSEASVYDAPEITSAPASPANDVWSLGMTLVEALTQRLPVWEPAASRSLTQRAEPAVPETLLPPFLEIARNCLRRDPQARCTVAEISARLNPDTQTSAASAAASAGVSVTAPSRIAISSTATAVEVASPGISAPAIASVDNAPAVSPLAVPLSPESPLPMAKQALQKQAVAKPLLRIQNIRPKTESAKSMYMYSRSFANSRYFVPAVAVVFAAVLIYPLLARHRPQPGPTATVSRQDSANAKLQRLGTPNAQPAIQPESKPKSHSKGEPQPPTRETNPSVAERAQKPEQASLEPASNKERLGKNEASAASPAMPDPNTSAPIQPPPTSAVPASSGVVPSQVLNQVLPEISQKARATIHGTVRLSVKLHVNASGAVTGAELAASGPSKYFADQALSAARKWDFTPAKINGRSVKSDWIVRFDITQSRTQVFPSEATVTSP
jgi:TonB family protein